MRKEIIGQLSFDISHLPFQEDASLECGGSAPLWPEVHFQVDQTQKDRFRA